MSIINRPPNDQQAEAIKSYKERFQALEASLLTLPANRERALALTNLEQASMWATKAILEA